MGFVVFILAVLVIIFFSCYITTSNKCKENEEEIIRLRERVNKSDGKNKSQENNNVQDMDVYKKLGDAKTHCIELENKIKDFQKAIENKDLDIRDLKKYKDKCENINSVYQDNVKELNEVKIKINELESENTNLKSQIEKLNKNKNVDNTNSLNRKIYEQEKHINFFKNENKRLKEEKTKLSEKNINLNSSVNSYKINERNLEKEINNLKAELLEAKEQIEEYISIEYNSKKESNNYQYQNNNYQYKDNNSSNQDINLLDKLFAEKDKKIKNKNEEIEDLKKEKIKLKNENEKLKRIGDEKYKKHLSAMLTLFKSQLDWANKKRGECDKHIDALVEELIYQHKYIIHNINNSTFEAETRQVLAELNSHIHYKNFEGPTFQEDYEYKPDTDCMCQFFDDIN